MIFQFPLSVSASTHGMRTEATLTTPVQDPAMWTATVTAGGSRMPWGGGDVSQQRSSQSLGEILHGRLIYSWKCFFCPPAPVRW